MLAKIDLVLTSNRAVVASIYRITVLHYLLFSMDQCCEFTSTFIMSFAPSLVGFCSMRSHLEQLHFMKIFLAMTT